MYVEISGRRSGKTTRLVQAAVEAALKGHDVFVITPFADQQRRLHEAILSRIQECANFCGTTTRTEIKNGDFSITVLSASAAMGLSVGLLAKENSRVFYDEFDFIKDDKMFSDGGVGNFIISETGYYVTTPRYVRKYMDIVDPVSTDLLIKVLTASKGHYMSYRQISGKHHAVELGFTPTEETGQWCSL